MKSFILIELLISIFLFFISSIIFFNLFDNLKLNFQNLKIRKSDILSSTLCLDSSGKNLYECVVDFKIEDDNFIHNLKKKYVIIKQYKKNSLIYKTCINNNCFIGLK